MFGSIPAILTMAALLVTAAHPGYSEVQEQTAEIYPFVIVCSVGQRTCYAYPDRVLEDGTSFYIAPDGQSARLLA